MKYIYLSAVALLFLACNENNSSINEPEYLKHRRSEEIFVSQIKNIDSADVNVQHIKKTKYLFKKSTENRLLFTLHIKNEQTVDDAFMEQQMKSVTFLAQREILNYFSYNGSIFNFYQNGEQLKSYEKEFEK